MSETPSQKPRHALTGSGATPSVPAQGGPVEVPQPARAGDDLAPAAEQRPAVPAPSASPDAVDGPVDGTGAAEHRTETHAEPDDDAPTRALPVVPRPREAAGTGPRRPVAPLGRPATVPYGPGHRAVPGHGPVPGRAPGHGHVPGHVPTGHRPPSAPAGHVPGPPWATAVDRLPEPFRPAPLPAAAPGARASGGFRLPDFPARTRPVLPVVLGAATALVLALGVAAGVSGIPDASSAAGPAPVSTP
ncbi:hypothetical protein [Pseudonocardia spirodelae]|uniref:Uncharacterized protein n=1 Tax=Pseudonocardia spirodelae TaxID=3133431 RepID=A0ABU8T9L9_9PSEU